MAETTSVSRAPPYLQSRDPCLSSAFFSRFRESRESYGEHKEREVLNLLYGDSGWKRLNKPWFKQDAVTKVVCRRSPTSRLHPDGRTTVCIPYRLTFAVTVSHHDRYDSDTLFHSRHPWRLTYIGGLGTPSITRAVHRSSQTRRHRFEDRFKVYRS
jgi:hypothetical protein